MEQNLRPKSEIEDTFIDLSKHIGCERVVWRYDPIVLNDNLNIDYHKAQFSRMCEKIGRYTDTVTVSFVYLYPKLKTPLIRPITDEEITELESFIGKTTKEYGLRTVACCESIDIGAYNTCMNGCVYCYANDSPATTKRRYEAHNPQNELLVGMVGKDEKITDRNMKSNKQRQISLF